jgi:hypothetical protein
MTLSPEHPRLRSADAAILFFPRSTKRLAPHHPVTYLIRA